VPPGAHIRAAGRTIAPFMSNRENPRSSKSGPSRPSTPSLVIVDDDPSVVEVLEAVLRKEGYAVEGYTDPRTALERLQSGPEPGVILMDCVMPRLTGGELLEAVRKAGIGAPVVMMTALSDPGFCVNPGHATVLNKPFLIEDLLAEIRRAEATAASAA
jgi:CheY-like chemotaxis protein